LAFRVWHKELLLYRYALPWFGHAAIQLHYAAGLLVTFGDEWSPFRELLDVLQADPVRPSLPSPADAHPRQRPYLGAARLPTLGLGDVGAIRLQVQPAHRTALGGLYRAHLEDIGDVMLGLWVVGLVQAESIFIVVDGHVGATAPGHF